MSNTPTNVSEYDLIAKTVQHYIDGGRSTLSGGTRRDEGTGRGRKPIAGLLWIRAFEGSRSRGGRGQAGRAMGIESGFRAFGRGGFGLGTTTRGQKRCFPTGLETSEKRRWRTRWQFG